MFYNPCNDLSNEKGIGVCPIRGENIQDNC